MKIKVLGPGCKNCVNLESNVFKALELVDIKATVEKVTDFETMATFGVLRTPALVIDDVLVMSGRVATPKEIKDLILQTNG